MLETIPVRVDERFDVGRVAEFLRASGIDVGDLEVEQFPAGQSNLTYLLRSGEWEAVLRRPPLGPVPPRAHDMPREFQAGFEVRRRRRVPTARIQAALFTFVGSLAEVRQGHHAGRFARRVRLDPLRAIYRTCGLHVGPLLGSELFDGAPVPLLLLAPSLTVILGSGDARSHQREQEQRSSEFHKPDPTRRRARAAR